MAETIPGGWYKDAEGDGYHDAHGKPVSAENVAKFLALQQPQTPSLGALDPAPVDELALLKQQLANLQAEIAAQPQAKKPVKTKQPEAGDNPEEATGEVK